MNNALTVAIALPAAAALLSVLWPAQSRGLGLAGIGATFAWVLYLLWQLTTFGAQTLVIGGWQQDLGINLYLDGMAILMLCLANLVMVIVSAAAWHYFKPAQASRFWPLWLLMCTALNTLFLAADLFNMYVGLELLTLAAVALTTLGGNRASLQGGLRYLMVSLLGSLLFLAGVAILFAGSGRLDLAGVSEALQATPANGLAITLITAGLLAKSALLPMHVWLPPAHANAPAPVSAALSALVVKASFYLLLRLWLELFAPLVTVTAANVLGVLGSLAILWGSWQAWQAERLKLMAAYSTVAQIGYLFLFLPLLSADLPQALKTDLVAGVLLLMMSHALAKSAFFLCAGFVQQGQGHDYIKSLSGLATASPMLAAIMIAACVSLIGLPPSGTFLAKWQLISAAFVAGQWPWVLVIALGTLLAAGYGLRLMGIVISATVTVTPMPTIGSRLWSPLLLTLLATLGLGLGATFIWQLLAIGVNGWGGV